MSPKVKLDHCVVHVSDWTRSNAFYAQVLGAEVVPRGRGFAYRFGDTQLNLHGPGVAAVPVARDPVRPGNSDLCFEWPGPIAEAAAHLARCGVAVELGRRERERDERLLPRSGRVPVGVHFVLRQIIVRH